MSKPVVIAAVMAATVFGAPCARAQSADEAALRTLEGRFAAAVNAKDVAAIMKAYVPNETLFVFDLVPPRQYVGAQAYAKDWTELFATFKGPIKFEISDLSVSASGELGFGHSIQHLAGTDTKDQPIDWTLRVTDVYRKVNGTWLIVHEHVSVPINPETGKPDFTSKP